MISLQMLYVFVVERGCKHFLAAHRYFAVLLEVGQKQKKKEKKKVMATLTLLCMYLRSYSFYICFCN